MARSASAPSPSAANPARAASASSLSRSTAPVSSIAPVASIASWACDMLFSILHILVGIQRVPAGRTLHRAKRPRDTLSQTSRRATRELYDRQQARRYAVVRSEAQQNAENTGLADESAQCPLRALCVASALVTLSSCSRSPANDCHTRASRQLRQRAPGPSPSANTPHAAAPRRRCAVARRPRAPAPKAALRASSG